ncbi:uncharacterized protein LOC110178107 [Drosophila serrata]|uniref:uncharacterized protein LOC110178107 n=1 Tax=Drosophila serrata TaxID=7274 RepID=UPI000A1D3800|nr:uncharacterized protein LOC110178107 [Drosophila serrata]
MSDNVAVNIVFNALLCGATGYGLFKIGPSEHPWAFTSCLIGLTHGIVGLVSGLAGDDTAKKIQETTAAIIEIVPLPLVNVDLFLAGECNKIALGHGLFLAPLTLSVILAFWKTEGGEDEVFGTVHTLKVLTILGNITSLVFLALNEGSGYMAGMAVLAFVAKFGADPCEEHVYEGSGDPINYISWSAFFILTAFAVSGEK